MAQQRYDIKGKGWLPIAPAATLLATNAQGVRKLMTAGILEWRQSRANSRTLVVDEAAVLALRADRSARLKLSPDPLALAARQPAARRERGGLSQGHHLRMTLPAVEAPLKKK